MRLSQTDTATILSSFELFEFVTCNNHHGSHTKCPSSCCSRDYMDMPTPAVVDVVLGVLLGRATVLPRGKAQG